MSLNFAAYPGWKSPLFVGLVILNGELKEYSLMKFFEATGLVPWVAEFVINNL